MIQNNLLREIHEQPDVLRRVHANYVAQKNPALEAAAEVVREAKNVYFAGMATSEYANYAASALLSENGKVNFVFDVSELLYYHLPLLKQPGAVLVLVSQSGNSAEIRHILDELKDAVPVVGVFNDETSYLAQHSTVRLPMFAGPQLACGSKTNLATVALLNLLTVSALGQDLKAAGDHLLAVADSIERFLDNWKEKVEPLVDLLEGSPYTIILGRGPGRASAMFTATLFREVPKMVVEGMGAAAFRHGLREMIKPEHRVVIFAPQGKTTELLTGIARDLLAIQVPVALVTNTDVDVADALVIRTDPHPETWSLLLDMVPLQLVGYRLAERQGIEPGKLVISTYVTTVE